MNNYYVYKHIRLDTNTPCYIGKGKNKRCLSKYRRNSFHVNIWNKHGIKIIKLMENLTELEAFELEKEWIMTYRAYGYCEANFTDGGEGANGAKRSEKTKKLMSEAQLGNKNHMWGKPAWNKGIPMDKKVKVKISNSKKGKATWNKGLHLTEKHKLAISIAKGKNNV